LAGALHFNQIYRKPNRRKSVREVPNYIKNVSLKKPSIAQKTVNIELRDVSKDGLSFIAKRINDLAYIISSKRIHILPTHQKSPIPGKIKWHHYEEDNIVGGIQFEKEIDIGIFIA
jgi:hypothetical protein